MEDAAPRSQRMQCTDTQPTRMKSPVEDLGTDWSIVRRRSVILSGKQEDRPYVREDFSESLVSILESVKDNVASFGPLARNSEWFLSLKSDAAKDRMMSAGSLKVRGCTFYVRSADKTQFSARVHWAPPFIPNAAIVKVLEETCKLQSITLERSTSKGFEGIPTGIRRLVLTGMLTTCVMSLVLFCIVTSTYRVFCTVLCSSSP